MLLVSMEGLTGSVAAAGWAFDQEGILRDVPAAEGHRDWSHKPMLDVFPVEEKVSLLLRAAVGPLPLHPIPVGLHACSGGS